jgi:Fe-S cluster assembly protein SufB
MIHLGEATKSKIISKEFHVVILKISRISKIAPNATFQEISQCDSFNWCISLACTYPYLDIWNLIVEHEAKISKISEEQLFYLMQRGIELNKQLVY